MRQPIAGRNVFSIPIGRVSFLTPSIASRAPSIRSAVGRVVAGKFRESLPKFVRGRRPPYTHVHERRPCLLFLRAPFRPCAHSIPCCRASRCLPPRSSLSTRVAYRAAQHERAQAFLAQPDATPASSTNATSSFSTERRYFFVLIENVKLDPNPQRRLNHESSISYDG